MGWHDTAVAASQVQDGAVLPCSVADVEILLIGAHGRRWAIEDRCSHAACRFSDDGEIDGLVAICDCHGSEFDVRTGEPLAMPATDPIRTFNVRVAAGRVEVDL